MTHFMTRLKKSLKFPLSVAGDELYLVLFTYLTWSLSAWQFPWHDAASRVDVYAEALPLSFVYPTFHSLFIQHDWFTFTIQ